MNKFFLFALLFAAGPVLAQEPHALTIQSLMICDAFSINYAMLVAQAHHAKSKAEFDVYVDNLIAHQASNVTDDMKTGIRKFAAQAWVERDASPTDAGVNIFHECEQSLVQASQQ